MKNQLKLVLFTLAAFAVAERAHFVQAQNPAVPNQNPSQATSSQSPSQTPSPQNPSDINSSQNPSQTVPPQNPSQTIPPIAPSQPNASLPNPSAPNASAPNPSAPNPLTPGLPGVQTPSDAKLRPGAFGKLSGRIRTAITQAPVTSSGAPDLSATGLSVTNLKVTQSNGQVVLTGFVHSEKDKADAGARATAAADGAGVVNNLIVR